MLGHMPLDRREFGFYDYPLVGTKITIYDGNNVVMEGRVKGKAFVGTHVTDVIVIRQISKRELFNFIVPCGIKNWILLGGSRQDFLEFSAMYKTIIPFVNAEKYVQREDIKICMNA